MVNRKIYECEDRILYLLQTEGEGENLVKMLSAIKQKLAREEPFELPREVLWTGSKLRERYGWELYLVHGQVLFLEYAGKWGPRVLKDYNPIVDEPGSRLQMLRVIGSPAFFRTFSGLGSTLHGR